MDTNLLDEILNCPSLPSLPAVAIRVLELTSDPDVKMDELAKEIQFDQAISAKILRTVNSSFYGLRKRCSSIEHALVMLGLNPVKSLVLGFSLVSTVKGQEGEKFDYLGYWERGLITAVAAKFAAEQANDKLIADEAFLAGLFQDIGMIAIYRTLGEKYIELLEGIEHDHSKLTKAELDEFEIQHPVVGAMMCEKWKIPHEIVIPVRYHDRPTACPQEQSKTARCVALGNLVHGVLKADDPTETLRRAYAKASSWLGFKEEDVDELIKKTAGTTKELANLFSIDVGSVPDPEEVLAKADRQLIDISKNQQIESYAAKEFAELINTEDGTDPFTGALNRQCFTQAIRDGFASAYDSQLSMTVLQAMIDGYDELGKTMGESAQDEVVIGTSVLLRRQFEHMGGILFRLSDSVFAVVLPSIDRVEATQNASAACDEFSERISNWVPETDRIEELVKISMGVASLDDETRMVMKTPDLLVKAASRAVLAARASKTSTVRAFVPKRNAA